MSWKQNLDNSVFISMQFCPTTGDTDAIYWNFFAKETAAALKATLRAEQNTYLTLGGCVALIDKIGGSIFVMRPAIKIRSPT